MLALAMVTTGTIISCNYDMRQLAFIPVILGFLCICSCLIGVFVYETADKETKNESEIVSIKSIVSKDDRDDYYVCITKELKEVKIKKNNVKLKLTDSKPHIAKKALKSDLTELVAFNLYPFFNEDITIYISKPMKEKLINY